MHRREGDRDDASFYYGLYAHGAGTTAPFERVVQDAEDHTRIVMTLAAMYDVKPSEARERFKAYCSQSIQSWRECGGILLRAGDVLPE